jgi:hypothetical protein
METRAEKKRHLKPQLNIKKDTIKKKDDDSVDGEIHERRRSNKGKMKHHEKYQK